MTVEELGQRMGSRELSEWMAYSKLESEAQEQRRQDAETAAGATRRARKALRR